MTALTEFLFPAPARRSVGGILRWWEARRLAYNLFVGTAGVVTLTSVTGLSWILPGIPEMRGIPWIGVVVYAGLANLCYLLGPLTEIAVEKLGRGRILPVGPVLYRMGLTFAVGLTLFPLLLFLLAWIARIVVGVG